LPDKLFPVVPDTGTPKAARLATEVTGNPGRWVRLDCQHLRHVQQPVDPGQPLECPTCPPTVAGGLPVKAGAFAAEAVTQAGPVGLVDDAGRMASELVASTLRHTDAPVELTVDAGEDVVRIEVRDDDATAPGTGKVVSFELRHG
jgi:hypothetical protein